MNIHVPKGWVKVSESEFEKAMSTVDYKRSGYVNGEYYLVRDERVAIHVAEGYYLDPEYFK